MRPPDPRHYRVPRSVIAVAGFVCALLLDTSPGWGYRFYPSRDGDSIVPRSDTARHWRETVWGPGDSLVWHVHDGSDWSPHFGSAEEVVPLIETAAGVWSRVATADLRMRVGGPAEVRGAGLDGLNLVVVGTEEPERNFARRWSVRNRATGHWEHVDCDVTLGEERLERIADVDVPNRLSTVIHEIGHCIGLSHAAVTPTMRWDLGWTDSSVWQKDPVMSYGWDIDNELAGDEVIGASLLRPARGWLRTTGSISGQVLHDGDPAAFVSVHVLRNEGGRVRPRVQVFTGETGEFLAEGLAPGEYLLWIHPIIAQNAHGPLVQQDDFLSDLNDSLDLQMLVVRAGRETRAGEFTLSRGRVVP